MFSKSLLMKNVLVPSKIQIRVLLEYSWNLGACLLKLWGSFLVLNLSFSFFDCRCSNKKPAASPRNNMIVYQRVVLCLRNGTLLWIWSSKLFYLFLEVKFVVIASSWNSHHFSPLPLPPAFLQKNCQLVNQGGIVNLTRNLMKQLFISFFVFLCSPLQQTSRAPFHIPRTLLAGIPRIWQKINQTFFP